MTRGAAIAFAFAALACQSGGKKKPGGLDAAGGQAGGGGAGGSAGAENDAVPPDLPRDRPAEAAVWPGACDPVLQNCEGTNECVFTCPGKEFTCRIVTVGGTLKSGEACGQGVPNDCTKGSTCVGSGTSGVCRVWCDVDADCPAGKKCTGEGLTCPGGDPKPVGRLCQA